MPASSSPARRPSLLGPRGLAALARLVSAPALFAFDFDGTIAPILPRPDDVYVPAPIAARLQKLAQMRPVAVVTGRRIADVRGRLGFVPSWIVGNHGAEDEDDPDTAARARRALDPLRDRLRARESELAGAGVLVEDKGQSFALHLRTARDRAVAAALIEDTLSGFTGSLRVFGGKFVYNAVAADMPDKAMAVLRLVERAGAQSAFFAGDDVNDEPVFAAPQPHWVTVRIGCQRRATAAQFCIDGPHAMSAVLDRILALVGPAPAHDRLNTGFPANDGGGPTQSIDSPRDASCVRFTAANRASESGVSDGADKPSSGVPTADAKAKP